MYSYSSVDITAPLYLYKIATVTKVDGNSIYSGTSDKGPSQKRTGRMVLSHNVSTF